MSESAVDDADGIVLEAGGELFTVARCRLVQESPLFRDMFVMATSDVSGEKDGTLESPLHTGDDADMLRDFLWALRVRPPELIDFIDSPQTPEKAVKLINVACLAHKYQDPRLANWALRQLHQTLSPTQFALRDPVLKPLLRALVLFEDDAESVKPLHALLRSRVEAAKSAAGCLIDLIELIQACTTSGCSSLLPTVYYALLVSPQDDVDWVNDARLTESNKRQLFRGAYRLSEEWYRVCSRCPPSLEQKLPQCPRTRPADLLFKLQSIPAYSAPQPIPVYSANRHWGNGSFHTTVVHSNDNGSHSSTAGSEHHRCTIWRAAVDSLIEAFPQELGDYFGLGQSPSESLQTKSG